MESVASVWGRSVESSLGFFVASNGCAEFRLEVGRTTFFSWRIGRLRDLVRFLGFGTSLRVGAGQRFFGLRHISEVSKIGLTFWSWHRLKRYVVSVQASWALCT